MNVRLEAVLDFSDDGLGILQSQRTESGHVVDFIWEYANRPALRLLNVDGDELIGSTVTSTFAEPSTGKLLEYLRNTRSRSDLESDEVQPFRLADDLSISARRINDGVVVRLCETEERQQTRALARLAAHAKRILSPEAPFLDRLRDVGDALISFGADFAVISFTPAGRHEPVEIIRASHRFKHTSELRDIVDRWKPNIDRQGSRERVGTRSPSSDILVTSQSEPGRLSLTDTRALELRDAIRPSSMHVIPIRGAAEETGTVHFGTSSEHAPLSEEQVHLARLLVRPVVNAVQIEQLQSERRASGGIREQFVSTVAHEIKTPLTAIRGYGQLLNRYLTREKLDVVRARRAADGLKTQIDRFLKLSDDLFDVARIHHGRLDLRLEQADLGLIAREAVERMNAMIDLTGRVIALDVDEPILGVWDASRLDQVLFILLSNAVEYSYEDEVRVVVWREDENAFITVTDHGIGIDRDDIERLFAPFERGHAAQSMSDGSGLGLYLAREIVQRHGGRITVWSRSGVGSAVTVQLPIQASPSSP